MMPDGALLFPSLRTLTICFGAWKCITDKNAIVQVKRQSLCDGASGQYALY